MSFRLPLSLALLLALCWSALAAAQLEEEVQISELTYLDLQYMAQQRLDLDELARAELGQGFTGDREHDLALLQRLLDEQVVAPDDKARLQGMGILLGDLLAEELDMDWVVYSDEIGRSRALRYADTDHYLFPVTMISRRREAGDETPVVAIYAKAYGIIDAIRPKKPYQ
jgi:hypothetical protein